MNPTLIVHSRAFSHRKVATDIARTIGGIVASYNDYVDSYGSRVVVVSTVDYLDIACSARFLVPASRCVYYGVAEGIPVLTPLAREIISTCIVVAPSGFSREMIERAGVEVSDIVPHAVIRRGVSPSRVAEARERWLKQTGAKKLVGWIGANQYRKGIDVALAVAEYLPKDIGLVMLSGYGEIEIPRNLPRNVLFMDRVYRMDNVFEFYSAIDALLITSRSEGFCLPLYETLSLGRRAVVPDIPVFSHLGRWLVEKYGVHRCRYELYRNYMWMYYCEPRPDEAAEAVLRALKSRPDTDTRVASYIEKHYGVNHYRKIERLIRYG